MTSPAQFSDPPADNSPLSHAQLEQLIELHNALLAAAAGNADVNIILQQLCQLAERIVDNAVASVMLLDERGEALRVHTAPSIPEDAIAELDGLKPGEGSCGNAVLHNREMYVCDTLHDARWQNLREFARKYRIGACWSSPIHDEAGKAIGSFALSSFSLREPDNFQRRLLNSCASMATIVLHRQQSLDAQRAQRRQLAENLQRYRALLENNIDGINLIDRDGRFIDANPAAYETLGYSREEYLQLRVQDIETEPGEDSFEAFFDQLPFNRSVTLQGHLRCKDGSIFEADVRIRKFVHDNRPMLISCITDTRDRKQAEEEMLRADKLESIGLLAGGIAHDFNNLLGIIMGHIDLAMQRLGEDQPAVTSLRKAHIASSRAADLTRQLLTFAKGGAPVKKVQDIRPIVQQAVDFSMHGTNIETAFECHCEHHLADVDKGQISQVIQNLVINARQAMPDGGKLSLHAANIEIGAHNNHHDLAPGCYIHIRLCDTGPGIPPQLRTRIFDPYFTTKPKGSGLGLALCYSIIKKHGGHIYITDNLPQGACFNLLIPASSAADTTAEDTAPTQADAPLQARVLLMDDDELIREVASAMLENMGCEVTHAENGEQAVALYEQAMQAGRTFDLVVMDLTIPQGMGGKDAMQAIRALDGNALGLVSSGYSNDPVMANCEQYGFAAAVGKPYMQDELVAAVRRILPTPATGGNGE